VIKSTVWTLCAALSIAPALAQPGAKGTPETTRPSGKAVILLIVVAEIDRLPKSVRKEVDTQIARMSDGDVSALRRTLSALPAASSALIAKGKSLSNVIAAALDDEGGLLIVTATEV